MSSFVAQENTGSDTHVCFIGASVREPPQVESTTALSLCRDVRHPAMRSYRWFETQTHAGGLGAGWGKSLCVRPVYGLWLASFPGRFVGGGKTAWYRLFAHGRNIPVIQQIFSSITL